MAKNVGRLAGLAALAGAAYMMSKGKGKGSDDAGDQKTSSYTGDTKKVEAKNEPFVATHGSSYTPGNAGTARPGVGDATNGMDLPKPPPASKKEAVDPFANYEGGDLLTGTQSSMPASNVPDAIRNENVAKTNAKIAQADANKSANKGDIKTASKKYSTATDAYKNLSRAAAVVDARKREEKQLRADKMRSSGGRRAAGGAIKKMASGGMTSKVSTASSRADGIASRGKTKCKMY
jgi:hypothetical protein